MSASDTPRTDAAEAAMTAYNGNIDRVTADFARQLERDLAARDAELEAARPAPELPDEPLAETGL